MVVRNRANCIKKFQIVFARSIIASPTNNIVGREMALSFIDVTNELVDDLFYKKITVHSYFLSSCQATG